MATKKISALTELTTPAGTEELIVNAGGTSKKVQIDNLPFSDISSKVSKTGDTMTGDLSLGDAVKATFGASDDLEIYHDSSDSIIKDNGSGDLRLETNGTRIRFVNSADDEVLADFINGGAVNLYNDGSKKFETSSTGVDITGSVTCDGNVGIGVTPKSWHSDYSALQVGRAGSIQSHKSTDYTLFSNNSYNATDGVDKYISTNEACQYEQHHNGYHTFKVASSGTADSAISWTDALKIDNSGNLEVSGNLQLDEGSAGNSPPLVFGSETGNPKKAIFLENFWMVYQGHDNEGHKFRSVDGSGNTTDDMVIKGNGDVVHGTVGTGNPYWKLQANGSVDLSCDITSNRDLISFRNPNGQVGSVRTNGSATSYLTSSDYRLKENVTPLTGSIDRLKELKPSKFNFIADAETTVDGFLAHEAQSVVPEAISGEKDAMTTEEYEVTPEVKETITIPAVEAIEATYDDEGNILTEAVEAQEERTEERVVTPAVMGEREVEDYQGIDQSKLVPLLVSALQEAVARIEQLENA